MVALVHHHLHEHGPGRRRPGRVDWVQANRQNLGPEHPRDLLARQHECGRQCICRK